jgi:methionyl aminopeptidase
MTKSEDQIRRQREAGRITGMTLTALRNAAKEGVSTRDLDRIAEDTIISLGGCPAFKGLYGYPHTLCTAINEEVVHGFPNRRRLHAGDIIGMDVGAIYEGMYADSAITVGIGEVSPEAEKIMRVTEEALWKGIAMARAGNRLGDISHAVQAHVEANGFSVVRDYVGHGVGEALHEPPQIPNFGEPGTGPLLVPGMTLAIEPMVNVGGYEVKVLGNQWTVVTRDRSLSAHFEHTVLVTDGDPEVLTLRERDLG